MTVDAVSDLDLSYTQPLGSPWDAVQMAAQAWVMTMRLRTSRRLSVCAPERNNRHIQRISERLGQPGPLLPRGRLR
jgi:hypothetical protein